MVDPVNDWLSLVHQGDKWLHGPTNRRQKKQKYIQDKKLYNNQQFNWTKKVLFYIW